MKQQIRHLPVHRNARAMALLSALVSGVGVALMLAMLPFATSKSPIGLAAAWLLVAPLLYAALAYATTALVCAVYNVMAARWGGFELELGDARESAATEGRFPPFPAGGR